MLLPIALPRGLAFRGYRERVYRDRFKKERALDSRKSGNRFVDVRTRWAILVGGGREEGDREYIHPESSQKKEDRFFNFYILLSTFDVPRIFS